MRISPLLAIAAIALPACATAQAPDHAAHHATPVTAEIKGPTGATMGTATLTEAPSGVLMRLQVSGLTPGWHGIHFH